MVRDHVAADHAYIDTQAHLLFAGVRLDAFDRFGQKFNFDLHLYNSTGDSGEEYRLGLRNALEHFASLSTTPEMDYRYTLHQNKVSLYAANSPIVSTSFSTGSITLITQSERGPEPVGDFSLGPAYEQAIRWLLQRSSGIWSAINTAADAFPISKSNEGPGYLIELPEWVPGTWPEVYDLNLAMDLSIFYAQTGIFNLTRPSTDDLRPAAPSSWVRPEERVHRRGSHADRVLGSLLAGAWGDSIGYSLTELNHSKSHRISSATQMAVLTTKGMSDPIDPAEQANTAILKRYREWAATQEHFAAADSARSSSSAIPNPFNILYEIRSPGPTVLAELNRLSQLPGDESPAQNNSKGAAAVSRSAPYGFISDWTVEQAFHEASAGAALTHGNRTAQVAAGSLAIIIRCLMNDGGLIESVTAATAYIGRPDNRFDAETARLMRLAAFLALQTSSRHDKLSSFGEGVTAEQVLAIAIFSALTHPAKESIADALKLASSHSGDTAASAAVCGNILGALHGKDALTHCLIDNIEGAQAIRVVAAQFNESDQDNSRGRSASRDSNNDN